MADSDSVRRSHGGLVGADARAAGELGRAANLSRVYLAGPEVFLADALVIGARKKLLCGEYGFEGVFPVDNQVEAAGMAPRELGLRIGELNEQLIRSCHAVIANVTPFRGPSADVGTAYEMGVAAGLGLVVCAYSNTAEPFFRRTVSYLEHRTTRGQDGQVRDTEGLAIENFDLHDNLMLESCVARTGGVFVTRDSGRGDGLRAMEAFQACLRRLRAIVDAANRA